jgi:hypothetical protein
LELVPEDFFAAMDLIHFLISPHDALRQKQARTVVAARLLGQYAAPKDLLRRTYVQKKYFEPAGGFSAVVNAPPNSQIDVDAKKAFAGSAAAAGHLLIFIVKIQRFHQPLTASQNRAAAVLRTAARLGGPPAPPEREFSGLWKAHGATAPLWAAVHTAGWTAEVEQDAQVQEMISPGSLRKILSWAAWYRDFALNHTPPSSQGPMLTADRAIILPAGIAPAEPPLAPLSEELLAAAKGYRAPTPEQ